MLSIAHVICTEQFAGVERHTVMLAAAQAAAGNEVTVIGGHPRWMAHHLQGSNVGWAPAAGIAGALRSLRALGPTDVVNAHMTRAEAAAVGGSRSGSLVVATRHFALPRGSSRPARWGARLAARGIGAQIAVSDFVARHIDGPSVVVHPGTAVRRDPVPAAARDRVVLVAQRLEQEKETAVALRAFERSGLATEGWRLRVAGTGSEEAMLRRLAVDLGVAHAVDFLGHVLDIDAELDSAAVMLAPRSAEDFGLSVLEAMAAGLPVVGSRAAGHLETAGRAAHATLFPPGDADEAARLLRGLAGNEATRAAYGQELVDIQRSHFTVDEQERRTASVYRSAL